MRECCEAGNCGLGACDCSPKPENPCPGVIYRNCAEYKNLSLSERKTICNQGVTPCYLQHVQRLTNGEKA